MKFQQALFLVRLIRDTVSMLTGSFQPGWPLEDNLSIILAETDVWVSRRRWIGNCTSMCLPISRLALQF